MQLSQEVVLLRDAMTNAVSGRGYFSVSDDKVLPSAKLVEHTVKDVMDMMTIDERTVEDRVTALRNMHAMLFHKTLQSSGNLHGALKEHFEHVCSSIPYVSWSVYVQAVLLCNWHDFAKECWSNLDECVFAETAQALARNLESLNDKAAVKLWRHLLHCLFILSFDEKHLVDEVVCKVLRAVPSVEMASEKAAVVFEQLEFFSGFLHGNLKRIMESEASNRILNSLLSESSSSCDSLNDSESTCLFRSCLFSVKKLFQEATEAFLFNLADALAGWLKKVQEVNAINNPVENESAKIMESVVTANNADFSEECLNQLVENLRAEFDHKVISFLASRFHQLNQRHVLALMEIKLLSADVDIGSTIEQICFKAFSSWDLDVQDAHRIEHHTTFGLKVDPEMTTSGQEELTDVVNRLVSGGQCVETSTISDLSRLCWTFPMETIKVLVEHAMKHRQIQSIVKVLFHLRGSCAVKVSPEGDSLLIYTLKPFMLNYDSKTPLWNNCKALVEQLLKSAVLNGAELLTCLVQVPSMCCGKQLQIVQVVLHNIDDDSLRRMCKTVDLAVFVLLVVEILEKCESCSLHTCSAETRSTWDLMFIKQEALTSLRSLAALFDKHPDLLSVTDRTWLLKSSIKFHRTVRFRLRMALNNSDTSLTSNEEFSIGDLLHIASVSKATLHAVIKHICCKFPARRGRSAIIQQAFIKILPKLTALELRASMDATIMYYQSDTLQLCNPCVAVIEAIRDVSESLIVLSRLGRLSPSLELRIVEDMMTTVKALVDCHGLPSEGLTGVVFTMIRLSMDLVTPDSSAVPKLLIVDLVRRLGQMEEEASFSSVEQSCTIVAMVAGLKDEALNETVKRLTKADFYINKNMVRS